MQEFRESLLIMVSVPVYVIVIGAEMLYSFFHEKKLYSGKGLAANLYLTTLNFTLDILVRGLCLLVLDYFYDLRFCAIRNTVAYWAVLVLAEDFMYYWLHRADHYCRLFWAVHVTHHSSEEFNLTVGFRSSVFQPLYRFIYFIPLSLAGFKGLDIMFVYSATQIFGILAHTKTIHKLGILEHILVTPSHHRVHHGSNVKYLDRNMGMLLITWDKLFGTFQPEDDNEPVKYGLTKNIDTHHPLRLVFHEWRAMAADLKKQTSLRNKFMYVFGPPGWSHDGSTKTSGQLRKELRDKLRNGQ